MFCNDLGLIFKVLIRNNAVGGGEFCDITGFGTRAPSLAGSSTEPGCPNAVGLEEEEGEKEEEEGGGIWLPLLSRPELHVGHPLPGPTLGLL